LKKEFSSILFHSSKLLYLELENKKYLATQQSCESNLHIIENSTTDRTKRKLNRIMSAKAGKDQSEVILVGCGCPLRGMGWYHAVQMIGNECPSTKLCYIVEPWFMGAGM